MKHLNDWITDITLVIWGFMISIIYGLASIYYSSKGSDKHEQR
jgi:hypothetical protein